ncbi:hypothetical protein HAX54_026469, partial [Datura stramonium]|nr:hypothetical protein [Datura stramonium]
CKADGTPCTCFSPAIADSHMVNPDGLTVVAALHQWAIDWHEANQRCKASNPFC